MNYTNNICIKTFGCRLNISESESLAFQLSKNFTIVDKTDNANIIIINTCSVTETAESKFKRFVTPLLKNNKKIIVTGCYFDNNISIFHHENLKYIEKQNLFDEIEAILNTFHSHDQNNYKNKSSDLNKFPRPALDKIIHSRAFLKIQDGCDNSCTYCSVRFARGSAVSLDSEEVIKRFKSIIEAGFKEIIITGINIASYNKNNILLSHLLEKMIFSIPHKNTIWIQLSSLEAQNIDPFFYQVIENPFIKPYFHIPLQSGSPSILKTMNRQYTIDLFCLIIERIKKIREDSFISTDVIVGFPGETDADFNDTYTICKSIGFQHLHIFPYSKRSNTEASKLPNLVSSSDIKNRISALKDLSDKNKKDYYQLFLNKSEPFILTSLAPDLSGKSYHSLDIELKGKTDKTMIKGEMYEGIIQKIANFKAQIW